MKKIFKMEDLDCANCAMKMEEAIRKIDGVEKVDISFIQQRLSVTARDEDFDDIMKEAAKVCRKIEPDCRILF